MKCAELTHEPLACSLALYKYTRRRWKQERTDSSARRQKSLDLSLVQSSKVYQQKAGLTCCCFASFCCSYSLFCSLFNWKPEDASRNFREDLSLRRGCLTGQCGLHTGETPQSAREQKGSTTVPVTSLFQLLFLFETVLNCFYFLFKVLETNHGKAETRAHQWESGPAEDPHPGRTEERCKELGVRLNMTWNNQLNEQFIT